jgi:hypothetical protein
MSLLMGKRHYKPVNISNETSTEAFITMYILWKLSWTIKIFSKLISLFKAAYCRSTFLAVNYILLHNVKMSIVLNFKLSTQWHQRFIINVGTFINLHYDVTVERCCWSKWFSIINVFYLPKIPQPQKLMYTMYSIVKQLPANERYYVCICLHGLVVP